MRHFRLKIARFRLMKVDAVRFLKIQSTFSNLKSCYLELLQ